MAEFRICKTTNKKSGGSMIFKIKTDNLSKIVDTDNFWEEDVDAILENEIYNLRKEEVDMFGTMSSIVEVKEVA